MWKPYRIVVRWGSGFGLFGPLLVEWGVFVRFWGFWGVLGLWQGGLCLSSMGE